MCSLSLLHVEFPTPLPDWKLPLPCHSELLRMMKGECSDICDFSVKALICWCLMPHLSLLTAPVNMEA